MIRLPSSQRALLAAFTVAFTDAGLTEHQARRASATCLYGLVAGWNPSASSNLKDAGTAPASTYSTWLGRMQVNSYIASVNAFLRKTGRIALMRHPPDGGVVRLIGDVHEVPRNPDHPNRYRKTTRRVRLGLRLSNVHRKATASNKNSLFCLPWLVGILAWRSGGREWRIPYCVVLLRQHQHAPTYHVEILGSRARSLVPLGSTIALDRYYGTNATRQVIRKWRLSYRQRLIVHPEWYQYLHVGGRRVSSWELLKETINHPEARREVRRNQRDGRPRMYFVRKVRCQFEKDDAPIDFVISACAGTRRTKDGKLTWDLDNVHSLVVAAPPGSDVNRVLRDYDGRWDIEVVFRSHVNLVPNPSPKTIPAHVVAFLGHFVHMTLAGLLQALRLAGQLKGISIVHAAKVVLGQDPRAPPFLLDRG